MCAGVGTDITVQNKRDRAEPKGKAHEGPRHVSLFKGQEFIQTKTGIGEQRALKSLNQQEEGGV